MNRNALLIALLGLAAVLTLIIIGELLPDATPAAAPELAATTTAAERPRVAATEPEQSAVWVASLLRRPLFAANRRPADDGGSKAPRPTDTTDDDNPRLAGIILAPPHSRAIFQPAGDAKPVAVGVGDRVGGWTIQAIDRVGVTVNGPDGDQVLQPKRDPAAEAEAAQAQAAATVQQAQPGQPGQPGLPPGIVPAPNFPIGPRGIPSPFRANGGMPQVGAPRKQNQ
jgi:hypothetical protein